MPEPRVSTRADAATDDVVRRLSARGVLHWRLNTEDYPFAQAIAFWPQGGEEWLAANGQEIPQPTSVWYRRVRRPVKPDGMDQGVYEFCLEETRAAVVGSILGCTARWMSHPSAVWEAEFKPLQLATAARLGLTIPRTVVTNDPALIRAAFDCYGGMVVKPVRTGYVQTADGEYAIYTSRLLEEHLAHIDDARWSPAIYQEFVPKRYDVRVTIVGAQCYAAAIDSQSDPAARIDWRQTADPELPHYPVTLPKNVMEKLHELMRALHLNFGAIDFALTPTGQYVFFEINPSGQWLWLDNMLGFGISDAVADWLAAT